MLAVRTSQEGSTLHRFLSQFSAGNPQSEAYLQLTKSICITAGTWEKGRMILAAGYHFGDDLHYFCLTASGVTNLQSSWHPAPRCWQFAASLANHRHRRSGMSLAQLACATIRLTRVKNRWVCPGEMVMTRSLPSPCRRAQQHMRSWSNALENITRTLRQDVCTWQLPLADGHHLGHPQDLGVPWPRHHVEVRPLQRSQHTPPHRQDDLRSRGTRDIWSVMA